MGLGKKRKVSSYASDISSKPSKLGKLGYVGLVSRGSWAKIITVPWQPGRCVSDVDDRLCRPTTSYSTTRLCDVLSISARSILSLYRRQLDARRCLTLARPAIPLAVCDH